MTERAVRASLLIAYGAKVNDRFKILHFGHRDTSGMVLRRKQSTLFANTSGKSKEFSLAAV